MTCQRYCKRRLSKNDWLSCFHNRFKRILFRADSETYFHFFRGHYNPFKLTKIAQNLVTDITKMVSIANEIMNINFCVKIACFQRNLNFLLCIWRPELVTNRLACFLFTLPCMKIPIQYLFLVLAPTQRWECQLL